MSEDGENLTFERTKSSATCNVEDITGIIFGGFSSRYWMLRKHVNSLPRQMLINLPFFSWNCLTLLLENREIDLVVRDEEDMKTLLKFLCYKMETIDGSRGSATALIEAMTMQDVN